MFEIQSLFSWIIWNPNRVFFTIPYLNHPIVWYGVLFALGFLAAYMLGLRIFLIEFFSKNELTQDLICDEKKLLTLCQKHSKLFLLSELKISLILPLLNKYMKAKALPYSFFYSKIFKLREKAIKTFDHTITTLMIGLIVGARLGYVFFYGWPSFKAHPIEIIKIWEGGLASHGACIGLLTALIFVIYRQSKPKMTLLQILDILAILSGVLAFFIRLGNFVNQEIVGTPSQLPWAVIFKNPMGGEAVVARHPVQLYEALFYLFMAFLTYTLWKRHYVKLGSGILSGILLVNLFTFRFFIEFIKEHQGVVLDVQNSLQMGQVLSIPFILLGLALLMRPSLQKRQCRKSLS